MGISFPPLVSRLVHLSPAGVLLSFFFLLFFSVCFCAVIAYVCCWPVLFVCLFFLILSLVFVCKTLVCDPGVRVTVVGFPVYPWSCVLLVLRLACLSFSFRGVAACCVFSVFFAGVARLSVMFVLIGGAWGVLLSFVCLLLPLTRE